MTKLCSSRAICPGVAIQVSSSAGLDVEIVQPKIRPKRPMCLLLRIPQSPSRYHRFPEDGTRRERRQRISLISLAPETRTGVPAKPDSSLPPSLDEYPLRQRLAQSWVFREDAPAKSSSL